MFKVDGPNGAGGLVVEWQHIWTHLYPQQGERNEKVEVSCAFGQQSKAIRSSAKINLFIDKCQYSS